MATPRDTLFADGTARLYRFRGEGSGLPLLLVPSLINRWYVMDLRAGASLVEALVAGGLDTYCLDWGVCEDEDRYLTWEDVLARLGRAVRHVLRRTGAPRLGILGYCMGGTLSGIYTALNQDKVAALVNMLGPFDFAHAGLLGALVDKKHFDVETIAAAGNISAPQMQSGFVALRPTGSVAKYVNLAFRPNDYEAFAALEGWASDNVPFPAAAYVTYIKELYQENLLVKGEHHVAGTRVDLGSITCPTLTLAADRDNICPPDAARGLHDRVGSTDKEMLVIPGGHVGAVVGGKAKKELYPAAVKWLRGRLCSSIN